MKFGKICPLCLKVYPSGTVLNCSKCKTKLKKIDHLTTLKEDKYLYFIYRIRVDKNGSNKIK